MTTTAAVRSSDGDDQVGHCHCATDSSNNLGINAFYFSEPVEPKKEKDEYDVVLMEEVKCRPPKFTKWDQTVIKIPREATLNDFLQEFHKATDGLTCSQLYHKCNGQQGSPVSGMFLYEEKSWKASLSELYASKKDAPLLAWMKERYGEHLGMKEEQVIFPKPRRMMMAMNQIQRRRYR